MCLMNSIKLTELELYQSPCINYNYHQLNKRKNAIHLLYENILYPPHKQKKKVTNMGTSSPLHVW